MPELLRCVPSLQDIRQSASKSVQDWFGQSCERLRLHEKTTRVAKEPTLEIEVFEGARSELLAALQEHCAAHAPELVGRPQFAAARDRVTCAWQTDRAAAGRLFYRVPGDAGWRTQDFAADRAHRAALAGLPAQRSFEWYLLWWDEQGAMGADLSGLERDGWFATGR